VAQGVVVGHVAVSPVAISGGAADWYGLGPISVLPDYQRRGVGSQLMREAIRTLNEKAAAGCVVLGEPTYYSRFGFLAEPALVLAGVPAEYFQALKLRPCDARGTVVYHRAFAEA
jgi:putative acetyltransferase